VVAVDLDITIKNATTKKRSVAWRPRFRVIDTADVAPDTGVAAKVAAYQRQLSKELDVPLGKTVIALDSRKAIVRTSESAMGNLIADAMRREMKTDIALMNGGGIRGDKIYPAGSTITRRDVLTELPFSNKLYVVEMSGADFRKSLENGLLYAGKPNGRYPHLSGATVLARGGAIPGQRIMKILVDGQPVDPRKRYTIATNDFVLAGKEGYEVFAAAKKIVGETDAPLLSNAVMTYVLEHGTGKSQVEGRVRIE
ncbi:MAG TPA: 5'-nucleotidase, partial [Hyphomicrobiaceae bacterium]|nr:5'-nucleotidase [Hyphomicrobiaceae bacterium]